MICDSLSIIIIIIGAFIFIGNVFGCSLSCFAFSFLNDINLSSTLVVFCIFLIILFIIFLLLKFFIILIINICIITHN